MDHAIRALKEYLYAELDSYRQGFSTKKELEVLVKAINVLEQHEFGEKKTYLKYLLNE